MRGKLDIVGLVLGFIGLVSVVVITGLPMWKVTAFIGNNLIVMTTTCNGLWMTCIMQMGIKMECKAYDSLLNLPADLQAARVLMCFSILLAAVAMLVSLCGTRWTDHSRVNARVKRVSLALGGALFLLCCLTTLVSVSWAAHTVIRDFNNPTVTDSRKRELGAAIYVGWAAAAVLLAAGAILVWRSTARGGQAEEAYHLWSQTVTEQDDEQDDAGPGGSKLSRNYSKTIYV